MIFKKLIEKKLRWYIDLLAREIIAQHFKELSDKIKKLETDNEVITSTLHSSYRYACETRGMITDKIFEGEIKKLQDSWVKFLYDVAVSQRRKE